MRGSDSFAIIFILIALSYAVSMFVANQSFTDKKLRNEKGARRRLREHHTKKFLVFLLFIATHNTQESE